MNEIARSQLEELQQENAKLRDRLERRTRQVHVLCSVGGDVVRAYKQPRRNEMGRATIEHFRGLLEAANDPFWTAE